MKTRTRSNVPAGEVLPSPAPRAEGQGAYPEMLRISAFLFTSAFEVCRAGDGQEPSADEEEDQDTGDLSTGLDEDILEDDDLDTDRLTSTEALAGGLPDPRDAAES